MASVRILLAREGQRVIGKCGERCGRLIRPLTAEYRLPQIIDNVDRRLADVLLSVMPGAECLDACVGYLRLRGWALIADLVDGLKGRDGRACRVLVGMHRPDEDDMRDAQRAMRADVEMDGPSYARLRQTATEGFRQQIAAGVPTVMAESALRRLASQLRSGQVQLKLFLRHPLHAKLYVVERDVPGAQLYAIVGSSNLTSSGLLTQGELNVDVTEQDAAEKLSKWFEEKWRDRWSVDISEELASIIEASWAGPRLLQPYLIYLRMAWHLCEEAIGAPTGPEIPHEVKSRLLNFQVAAVDLAIRHLERRKGVFLGDVVGLGKTAMAAAVARVLHEKNRWRTLVIAPPNLTEMWRATVQDFNFTAEVCSLGEVQKRLHHQSPAELIILDESHNLREREGKRYHAIHEFVRRCDSSVILVTATPFNKHFLDIANQLRIFLEEDHDLRVRPERFFASWYEAGNTDADFRARFQCLPTCIRAFEQSRDAEDWRDVMRLFLVRRTRSFVVENYATFDPDRSRHFLTFPDGKRFYVPSRNPITVTFPATAQDEADTYARLYDEEVVNVIASLKLPRYGLAGYVASETQASATPEERRILDNLNRAGQRLRGFCRSGLFKRLESSGYSFLRSLDRHVLRNLVTLHAIENGLPVPIGTQDPALMDAAIDDEDPDVTSSGNGREEPSNGTPASLTDLRSRAGTLYEAYSSRLRSRFGWIPASFFRPQLADDLKRDVDAIMVILESAGPWDPHRDAKLGALTELVAVRHANDKLLVFTQFADTARYLAEQLRCRGIDCLEAVTASSPDPTALARRFSPTTNRGLRAGETELRVLVATDVLAEGQNLQDSFVVVNFDLPWAIIRLIQRAGRVDRIGQAHDTVRVYSFMPADGVEKVIHLRTRLSQRLRENQEVVGTDECFFGEEAALHLRDLYTEKSGSLNDARDDDVDLTSLALQVWNSATEEHRKAALLLPNQAHATRRHSPSVDDPSGAIVYCRYSDRTDGLVRVDSAGRLISSSMSSVFRAAACAPDVVTMPRAENHFELVGKAVKAVTHETLEHGGALGTLRSVSRQIFERLDSYRAGLCHNGLDVSGLSAALDEMFAHPMTERARKHLGERLRAGATEPELATAVLRLYDDDNLVKASDGRADPEPQVLCSLGLKNFSPSDGDRGEETNV